MKRIKVQAINASINPISLYATKNSSGMDLCANESLVLNKGERTIVGTGLFLAIPEGYEAQVRPRSGLAAWYGLTVLNSPGTIDADYRGEIKVILLNTGHSSYPIHCGDKIAQLVFAPVVQADLSIVKKLPETKRGGGGLGSTGK
jgi:dUTP pyrophosphatase